MISRARPTDRGSRRLGLCGSLGQSGESTLAQVKEQFHLQHCGATSRAGESYVESHVSARGEFSIATLPRKERRDNEWRIAHRRVLSESPAHGYDTSDFIPSRRNRDDISYDRQPVPTDR